MREKKTRRAREKMLVSVDKMVDFKGAIFRVFPTKRQKIGEDLRFETEV